MGALKAELNWVLHNSRSRKYERARFPCPNNNGISMDGKFHRLNQTREILRMMNFPDYVDVGSEGERKNSFAVLT
ncbi:hypothetical protein [Limisalsivibrio acetivorans]|uniref:hypothetical protein n=1 Tax=Limisalsivibrio acetivorans TaxID=1304888 RepID=UPI0003B3EDE6|nr:hypothetical protein [Limisalsivibrio acetivorans]